MTELSREALFDLVWEHPTRTLAATFGVSDVWLKKICVRAGIPTPDRGYWAKRAAGRPVVKAKLPMRDPGRSNEVSITKPAFGQKYDPEAELAEPIPPPPVFAEPLESVLTRVTQRIGKVIRCRDLTTAIPMVRKLLASDEKRREKQRASAYPSIFDAPHFDSPFETRRLRVLNALGLALARIGGSLDYWGKEARSLVVKVGDEVMQLTLDHPDAKPNHWGQWTTRQGPADTLKLELKPKYTDGMPQLIWRDGEGGKLEDQLTDIAIALAFAGEVQYRNGTVAHHSYLLDRRAENEAEIARRRAEAARKEHERQLRAQQERRNRLFEQARDWRAAQDIRSFVVSVLEASGAEATELETWATWARREADALDPILNASLKLSVSSGDDEQL